LLVDNEDFFFLDFRKNGLVSLDLFININA